MNLLRRRTAIGVAALLSCGGLAVASPAHAADPVTVNLIDVNDFHGRIDANTVKVAGTVEQLRAAAGDANTLFLSAGDNIGASLFASSSQKDQPTIDVLDALDLAVSAVGNHELDGGETDLTGRVEGAADYQHVAANIYRKGTTDPVLPAYQTFTVAGQDVAVIGATTEETASLVSPAGVANLEFGDPVEAVNRVARQLEASADKPDVIVASFHEGAGFKTPGSTTLEQEVADGGAFADIVTKTDPAVDAIFTGHTHKEYAWNAPVPGVAGKTRPVVQTGSYGERIGQVQLKVDPDTGEVVSYTAGNVARTTAADDTLAATYPRVAEVKTIVDDALAKAKALGEQPVATISADITTAYLGSSRDDRANESTLGNLVADAVLAQVSQLEVGADLGIANSGGLRAELLYAGSTGADAAVNGNGVVTFAEANAVLPFNNTLSSVSLKGSSLKKVFEQQWQRNPDGTVPSRAYLQLGTSENVRYTYDDTRPEGDRITGITIDGEPLDPERTYRVATFSFLGAGGDNFRAFTEGSNFDTGLQDYQAWMDYLKAESPVAPDYRRHAVKVAGDRDVVLGEALDLTFPKLDLTSRGVPATTSVSASLVLGGTTTDLGTFPATAGSARVTSPALSTVGAGTVRVTAQPTGTTFEVPVSVGKVASTTTAQGPDTVERGEQAVVDVEVTTEGDLVPSGRVDVLSGSTVVGTDTLADGVASVEVATTGLPVGARTLTVAYAGDDSVQASTGTVELKVERGASVVTVGQVAKAPVTGLVSVPVEITSATGATPTGRVDVLDGDTAVGSAELASGRATVRVPAGALGLGAHELDVHYAGDLQHEAATAPVSVSVTIAPTTLEATGYAGTYGTAGSVVVTGPTGATGTVTLTRGSVRLGSAPLVKGRAVVRVAGTALKPGSHTLVAAYAGNGTYAPAKATVRASVAKARSSVTAKVTRKVVVKRTRATVAVTVRASGVTVTSGTAGVYQGSKRVGTATVRNGKATVRLARFTRTGTQRLTVKYAGNALVGGSSTTVKVKVARR